MPLVVEELSFHLSINLILPNLFSFERPKTFHLINPFKDYKVDGGGEVIH